MKNIGRGRQILNDWQSACCLCLDAVLKAQVICTKSYETFRRLIQMPDGWANCFIGLTSMLAGIVLLMILDELATSRLSCGCAAQRGSDD